MKKDIITVCIPTYKRPHLLEPLLRVLGEQKTFGLFNISVIVIDNDREKSAWEKVKKVKSNWINIKYENEPVQNIALARNRAVLSCKSKYLAFIDDDEFPESNWLYSHYKMIKKTDADGILGPVKPYFENGAPLWLIKSGICLRASYPSGTLLQSTQTRTGNVLFDRRLFLKNDLLFDPSYGLTGGEDTDFFRRAIDKGLKFVWCEDAVVFENVPVERWTRTYYVKRAIIRGRVKHFAFSNKSRKEKILALIKSIAAFTAYSISIPVVLPLGEKIRMRVLNSYFHHAGMLTAAMGIKMMDRR